MAEELGVADWSKFVVVPLGLELERFAEVDREVVGPAMRSTLGIGPDELVIGIVGRMVPIKNHELWLEAVGALSGRASGLGGGTGRVEADPLARLASRPSRTVCCHGCTGFDLP